MSTVDLHGSNSHFGNATVRKTSNPVTVASAASNISATVWWTMLVCSGTALLTSSYLAWASYTSSPLAGCGGESVFDCNHVLHSRWSTVLSVPVSVFAIATHISIVALLLAKPLTAKMDAVRWGMIGFASLTAGAAALWFVGLQVFWLQHLCKYCLVAHVCGLLLATIFLVHRPVNTHTLKWIGSGAGASLVALMTLQSLNVDPLTYEVIDHTTVKGQSAGVVTEEDTLFEAPAANLDPQTSIIERTEHFLVQASSAFSAIANPASLLYGELAEDDKGSPARTIRVLNNVKLDPSAWPLLGKPEAELIFVELFDYTCQHCQRTHTSLEGARQKFGDRLAILVLPVPLNSKCNATVKVTQAIHTESCDLAKLAIAVWYVDHSKFADFHNYLFTAKPNFAQATVKAKTLVDAGKLDKILQGPTPNEFIAKHVSLYERAGAGSIPKLMFPQTTAVGAIESTDAMVRLIEQHLR